MLNIKCQRNIHNEIIGKITYQNKIKRQNYILVKANATKASFGYIATITQSADSLDNKLIVCDQLINLHEGDIVLIDKNDCITVLIDANSKSNFLALTDKCNHRCIMCPQPPVKTEESKLNLNLKILSLIDRKLPHLGITGGEPTVAADELILILNQIAKKLPHTAVTLLTNGVKLADEELVKKIVLCNIRDLQVDIPLFAAIPSIHNQIVGAKTFYKTLDGIYNLAKHQVDIGIRIVIHKLTYKRLKELSYFIYHNMPFVKQVAFMQMETLGLAKQNIEQLWIDPYDYKDELSAAINFLKLRGINALIYNEQLCTLNADVIENAVQSISDWKNIYLEECENCAKREQCGGFFASAKELHSKHIE